MTRTGYSRLGAVLTPSEFLLAKSGDVFGFQNLGNATGMQWVEAKNAAKHPATHSMVPYERELSRKSTVPRLRSFHPDYGGDRHHTPHPARAHANLWHRSTSIIPQQHLPTNTPGSGSRKTRRIRARRTTGRRETAQTRLNKLAR